MAQQMGNQPMIVLSEESQRTSGQDAQSMNITAGKAVAESVRTTLGPKGMDKMLVDSTGNVVVTNDGVTILGEMDIEHPAANMIVEVAETQEEEVGDGTTTSVVVAGELLSQAEDLLEQDIHATVLAQGYRQAAAEAKEILGDIAIDVDAEDTDVLESIAATAMTGKGAENSKDLLSELVVDSVLAVADADDLGFAGSVTQKPIAGDEKIFVEDVEEARAVTLILRGGTEHVVDEIERAIEDSLGVVRTTLEEGKVLPGGGAPEIALALGLRDFADSIEGREQLAIEAFADAVDVIPRTLAENAGLDPIDSLVELRSRQADDSTAGLDAYTGDVIDMESEGVVEPLRIKTQAIESATEAAVMILRIDDVIAAGDLKGGSSDDDDDEAPGGPGGAGGMGGMGGMGGGMGGMM